MQIGFIGFGEVSRTIFKLLKNSEINLATSDENRSNRTKEFIKETGIQLYPTFEELCETSDILISANSPSKSLKIAKKYGSKFNGIYLDLNNISPKTTFEIDSYVTNFVDGAIIGKIDVEKPIIYLAGKNVSDLSFLSDYFKIRIVSKNIGDVAILKMLRSIYTKSLSALLIESSKIASDYELYDEFFNILELTEGDDFKTKSQSRIKNTLNSSKRKSEELEEIIDFFKDEDLEIVKASLEKLKKIK